MVGEALRGSSSNSAYFVFEGGPEHDRVARLRGAVRCGRWWEHQVIDDGSNGAFRWGAPSSYIYGGSTAPAWTSEQISNLSHSLRSLVFVCITTQLLTTRRRFDRLGPARLTHVLIVLPFSISVTAICPSFLNASFLAALLFLFFELLYL